MGMEMGMAEFWNCSGIKLNETIGEWEMIGIKAQFNPSAVFLAVL